MSNFNHDVPNHGVNHYSNDSDGYVLYNTGEHAWQYELAMRVIPGQPIKVNAVDSDGNNIEIEAYLITSEGAYQLDEIKRLIMANVWDKVQHTFDQAIVDYDEHAENHTREEYVANVILTELCSLYFDYVTDEEGGNNNELIKDRFSTN